MTWFLPALGFSLCFAAYLLVNQHYRMSAHMLVLWRGLGIIILLSPVVIFLH